MAKKRDLTAKTEKAYTSPAYLEEFRKYRKGEGPEPEHVLEQIHTVTGVTKVPEGSTAQPEQVERLVRESMLAEVEAVLDNFKAVQAWE